MRGESAKGRKGDDRGSMCVLRNGEEESNKGEIRERLGEKRESVYGLMARFVASNNETGVRFSVCAKGK